MLYLMHQDALGLDMDSVNESVKRIGELADHELDAIVYEACLGQVMIGGLEFKAGMDLGKFVKSVALLGIIALQQKELLGVFTPKAGPPPAKKVVADKPKEHTPGSSLYL